VLLHFREDVFTDPNYPTDEPIDVEGDTMNDEIAGVPSVIPVLAVEDIKKAIAFYGHLGFNKVFSIPDPSGKLVHAHLRKGESALFLGRLDVSH
jgi:hypothetical protein